MMIKEKPIRPVIFLLVLFAIPNLIFLLIYEMSKFINSREFTERPLIIQKEAIIVVLSTTEMRNIKNATMDSIESELKTVLINSKAGAFGNKICDEKECRFSVLGIEADRLHQVIKPVLKKLPANAGYVYMVYDLSNSKEQLKKNLY